MPPTSPPDAVTDALPDVAGPVLGRRPSRREWRSLAGIGGFVALLHVLGWGTLVLVVAPQHYQLEGSLVFGAGLGLTAYTLGMRHAFDADHIAAIDNTTRAFLGRRQRPLSLGFWFALGHSSLVFVLCGLVALGVRALAPGGTGQAIRQTLGAIGLSVSAVFLLVVGVVNLMVLIKLTRAQRRGAGDDEVETHLRRRGMLARVLGRATGKVTKPWHMVVVGLLFGLGFDTASEVALLVLAGGAASVSLPWYAIMTLPLLFAAGMCLLDSLDGVAMGYAYSWANGASSRRFTYNVVVTSLSVVVALGIGGLQVMALVTDQFALQSGPVAWLGGLDLNRVGFLIAGLFLGSWALALLLARSRRPVTPAG